MKWTAALLLLAILSLTACASAGPDSLCVVESPIYLDRSDVLTTPTLRAVIAHNERGAKLCGWKAAK